MKDVGGQLPSSLSLKPHKGFDCDGTQQRRYDQVTGASRYVIVIEIPK